MTESRLEASAGDPADGGLGAGTAALGAGITAPFAGTAALGAGTAAPFAGTAASGAGTAAPFAGTATPGAGTAAPFAGTATPGAGTAAPLSHTPFSLGAESGEDGSFRRQASRFRCPWPDGTAELPVENGRYHLYAARACPWAHRTIIARRLMGLEDAIGISFVDPIRDSRGWAFTGGEYVDSANDYAFLSEAYRATDPGYEDRVSVPVLWDKTRGVIACNESADILRLLTTAFAPVADHPVDLYPEPFRGEIDALNDFIYEHVNNGVYRAGFSTTQTAYEEAVHGLFAVLGELDRRLDGQRFLFGEEPVETDWRLFTTLLRFDAVYNVHFKCSVRKLIEYDHLWPYARDLYQWPGVVETVDFDEIRAHYYRTHPMINPTGLVATMPAAADFTIPHGREGVR